MDSKKNLLPVEKFDLQPCDMANEGKMVYNFSPGPCILPRAVLEKSKEGIVDYKGCG